VVTDDVFRLTGPLPPERTTTVLEASAGTGKTYSIAGLVARFVADGHRLDDVLAVTFSRRATAELRDAIRGRLVSSRAAVAAVLAGGPCPGDDVDRLLADGDRATLAQRLTRLDDAAADVDAAPILTLHTFAGRMLTELGLLADHDPATRLGSDLDVLGGEVVADVYLSDEHVWGSLPWSYAQVLGRQALAHPTEVLHPPDEESAARVSFASAVRAEYDRRKRLRRVLDYDDMIGRLASALTDPVTGPPAADLLGRRFRLVLVDEFQDTDPQQWEFLRAAFHGRSTMVLIGDPKQAIYRFRGGDIETYTAAKSQAQHALRMDTNYRSDSPVVRGIEMIFGPVDLGTASTPIPLARVEADRPGSRLSHDGHELDTAVEVRALRSRGSLRVADARELVRRDVVGQVDRLLNGGYRLVEGEGSRPVRPSDIAVLVSTNAFGTAVHRALRAAGHSAVFTGEASVFGSPAAREWLVVLEALEDPSRWTIRRAGLTRLLGWTSDELADPDAGPIVELTSLVNRCSRLLTTHGIAAVFETLVAARDLYGRLLDAPDGEAMITDLRHIAELLNEAQTRQRLDATALTEHLRRAMQHAGADQDERTRRLPTDRPAVRVMTVHQAKGLQFPIVLVPQAADSRSGTSEDDVPMLGHLDGVRVLDVAPPASREERAERYWAEDLAESLRSFYVACTRAQSLLVCWWSPTQYNTPSSPLHRLLSNTQPHTPPEPGYPLCPADDLPLRPGVGLTVFDPPDPLPRRNTHAPDAPSTGVLEARTFVDRIDRDWVRTSYTGLTRDIHDEAMRPEALDDTSDMELEDVAGVAVPPLAGTPGNTGTSPASRLASSPGGTQFGSLVHQVLEQVDPASSTLDDDLAAAVAEFADQYQLEGLDRPSLVAGLRETVETPLGVLTDGRSLRDLGAINRLAELDFELPLGGQVGRSRLEDLAGLFGRWLPPGDPLRSYGEALGTSAAATTVLAGFLTGSIDVALRVPPPDGTRAQRFVILDYKTNRVPAPPDEPLTAAHYSPATMTATMIAAHYPLQALLYGVALHRYLAWRLPGYRPQTHLGGVGYLFVRGMVGHDTPLIDGMPAGVFTWLPPADMIVEASRILAGGERRG